MKEKLIHQVICDWVSTYSYDDYIKVYNRAAVVAPVKAPSTSSLKILGLSQSHNSQYMENAEMLLEYVMNKYGIETVDLNDKSKIISKLREGKLDEILGQ